MRRLNWLVPVVSVLLLVSLASIPAQASGAGSWTSAASMPTPRSGLAAAVGSDDRIYALGGCCDGSGDVLDTVEAYDPGTNTWSSVAPLPEVRAGAGAVTSGDRIYVIGGTDGFAHVSTVEAYNTSTNTWIPRASLSS